MTNTNKPQTLEELRAKATHYQNETPFVDVSQFIGDVITALEASQVELTESRKRWAHELSEAVERVGVLEGALCDIINCGFSEARGKTPEQRLESIALKQAQTAKQALAQKGG